ncbi:pro-neuregulin-3, membrane-bound isoform [Osmerus mordax]|uniref:pro-neuregulin-3, membrane-bound isoform n=1 Tax=Osmerus mordax TaxID=8014 RepID=UPI00350EADB3
MSERSGASTLAAMSLEEPGGEQASPRAPGPLRCGPCALLPRQQTWLCAVPLVMGFVGLGLSLMLLKWIVVGSVQDYVPTDLVDAKGIGQDPIFMSQPSSVPKGSDTSTLPSPVSSTTPLAADGTAPPPRTRADPPANHSANGSPANGGSNRAPHLHNSVVIRVPATVSTTTARPPRGPAPGREATPRGTSTRRENGQSNGRNGASNPRPRTTSSTTTTTLEPPTNPPATKGTPKVPPPTAAPGPPLKPTRWSSGRPPKGPPKGPPKAPATRPHHRFRTPVAPTSPSLRSEVFQPCLEDKDLAFCLNEGECSIIQTVAGVHRHCRCKEGYHGLRCDQFVPKTDAILSDPVDELGIEFMERRDAYQSQVLSICSIASVICLLCLACMALYRRNRRHREKLRAHFSESHILRDCSNKTSGLMAKSSPRPQSGLQLQKVGSCAGASGCLAPAAPGMTLPAPPALHIRSRAPAKGKLFRSSSLSLSPAQQHREANHPGTRGKSLLIGGARVAGHAYKHLQEVDCTEMEAETSEYPGSQQGRVMPSPLSVWAAGQGWTEVPCTRLDSGTRSSPPAPSPSSPPPSGLRAHSVPIIPSLQGDSSEDRDGTASRSDGWGCDAAPAPSGVPAPPGAPATPGPGSRSPSCHASGGAWRPGPGRSQPLIQPAGASGSVAEPEGRVKHESVVGPVTALSSYQSRNTAGAALEPEGKTRRCSSKVHSCSRVGGHRAGGQRETQSHLLAGGTHCLPAELARGRGSACAKPSAS